MMKSDAVALNEVRRLRPADADYPERVLEIPGRARVLRALGDLDVLESGPSLAVVGTRDPSEEVIGDTRKFVELSQEFGMVIVSGLAPGVDITAHEAALELDLKTIAVPGCGLEALLESERSDLVHRIVDAGGLVLSPFPGSSPETSERRWWRNRIIAAICHGIVVVASEEDGGAWEAQRWARQLERWIIEPSEEST